MARRPETLAVIPSPRRLIEALRDVGYDFVGAVADLIDNSIAAKATTVDVWANWDGADSWLRIADDGTGMDAATITESLRFGSERSYRQDDLGKFGLGLKTASLSQCRQIWVASRVSTSRARIEARRFDLDRIIRDDKWEVEAISPADRPEVLVEPLKQGPGTVVLWTQLDRLFGSRVPHGPRAQLTMWDMVERLEQHLSMVFHRFLEGDVPGWRRKPLVITLNGNQLKAWNPFAPKEERTQHLQSRDFDISAHGASGIVTFDPWVLPAKEKFSSESEFNRLSGPSKWNQQQGFYIYRANRMIQSGGWSRLRAPDEHTKLARVALEFYPELDSAFGINIAKMRVQLPTQLRERLKGPIEDLIRAAKRAYTVKPSRLPTLPLPSTATSSPPGPATKPTAAPIIAAHQAAQQAAQGSATAALPWPPPPLVRNDPPRNALEKAAADAGEAEALERIVSELRKTTPGVARDLGW